MSHISPCVPIKMGELETVRKSYFRVRGDSTVVLLLKGPMDRISSLNMYIRDI